MFKKIKNNLGLVFTLTFLVLGAIVLVIVQKPLQESQDARKDASVADGMVIISASPSSLIAGQNATVSIAANTQGLQTDGIEMVFNITSTANLENLAANLAPGTNLLLVRAEASHTGGNNYLLHVIVIPQDSNTKFASDSPLNFVEISFVPTTVGSITFSVNDLESFSSTSVDGQVVDQLKHVAPFTYQIEPPVNENACQTSADCGPDEHCYQPPMPPCPEGTFCTQVLPDKECRSNNGCNYDSQSNVICASYDPRPGYCANGVLVQGPDDSCGCSVPPTCNLELDTTKLIPINWTTDTVSLQADGVFIKTYDMGFYSVATADYNFVKSDPGDDQYTSLEISWQEHGVEMRVFIYFNADGSQWWSDELRTYNGHTRGDWVFHKQNGMFKTDLGQDFIAPEFELQTAQGDTIFFKNLKLRAFKNYSPGYEITDLNHDGKTNLFDYSILVKELTSFTGQYDVDLNDDGAVNLLDYSTWIYLYLQGRGV